MKALFALVAVSSLLGLAAPAQAQVVGREPARITSLMSAQDLEATGIANLSPEQIDALSAWVENYRRAAQRLALVEYIEGDVVEEAAVKSRIDGDFDGWVGDTVFRLQNGQIWQQVGPSARYLSAHAPRVTISAAPHRLRVEGLQYEVAVRRLR